VSGGPLLDALDVGILAYLDDKGPSTTTKMAKEMYEPKDRRELVKYDNSIRARLKNLVKTGLVERAEGEKAIYSLNKKAVYFGTGKIYVPRKDGTKRFIDIGDFISVKTADGNFYLRTLSNRENGNGSAEPVKK
jgi:hypothetical protein